MKLPQSVKRFFQPTLVRRVLIAQFLLLSVLWSLLIAFIVFESKGEGGILRATSLYKTLQSIVETMEDKPRERLQVLKDLDFTIREEYGKSQDPLLAPSIIVRSHGQIIYHSVGAPLAVSHHQLDTIEETNIDGMRWLSMTKRSDQGTDITFIRPADEFAFFIYLNSHGYYLLPLLISLPFLLLPAWLAIRIALKPWRQVVAEVATRGPDNLAPLNFAPEHAELRTLVTSINALLQRVHESTERERSFIADAAHELRTPIAAMRINVEALQNQTIDPRQRELLSGILNSCNRAARMVAQLLLLMRSEAKEVAANTRVSFNGLLQDRIAILTPLADERGIDLVLLAETEIEIVGKREGLMSLVDNLVGNAIKYSPDGGQVSVGLKPSGTGVLMTVSDQGSGIDPALRERVFDRFFRAPDQVQSGSGLGLTIARSVVLQHGGRIALEGAPDGGLLVVVWLPLESDLQHYA